MTAWDQDVEAGVVPSRSASDGLSEHHVDPEPLRVRESPARMIAQIALAVAAIGIFVAYVFVWRGDIGTARPATFLPLLGLFFLILLVEVLLLRPVYGAFFRRVPRSLPLTPDEDNYVVGCPGCGTVFTVLEADLEVGSLSCHNCGRQGYVKDYSLNRSAIKREHCKTCGNAYLEFMEHSECPVCHTFNPY